MKEKKVTTKKITTILFAVFTAAILGAAALSVLTYFCDPMEDLSYDLSLTLPDGAEGPMPDKGWTIFTDEQGQRKELAENESGIYTGLDYPGQTYYSSRTLVEKLDSPTLRINAVNWTVSVFLDDDLIYTDCPEADNRIGYLELPMLDYDRTEPLIISLPPDFSGKTLVIAQSTPAVSETINDFDCVFPCTGVYLYCGYSYESSLIADAFSAAVPAVVLFAAGIFILVIFVRHALSGRFFVELLLVAFVILLKMLSILVNAPFFSKYITMPFSQDWPRLLVQLSIGILLIFLTIHKNRFRRILAAVTILQLISILLSLSPELDEMTNQLEVFLTYLPDRLSLLGLLTALACSFFMMKSGSIFHKHLFLTAVGLLLCYAAFLLVSVPFAPDYALSAVKGIMGDFTFLQPVYTLQLLWAICLAASTASLLAELLKNELESRLAISMLKAENELAINSYKSLKQQHQSIYALRHDTMKHYTVLRTMLDKTPERIKDYLDQLIGQDKAIRPIVQSGNEVLDILLNGKLSAANDAGIRLDILHARAPEKLPLSDAELCSLVINILDNAINAASAPEITEPYIKLNLQCKNKHFIFSCENSTASDCAEHGQVPSPEHGFGLKIIKQIMKKYNDMMSIEQTKNTFKISIAIPV